MREAGYLKLWQQKRSEWQISDDAGSDWDTMASLLDENMPVEGGGSTPRRGFRLLPIIFISLSAAAMVFVTAKVVKHEWAVNQKHKNHHHKGRGITERDSAYAESVAADSANTAAVDTMYAEHKGDDDRSKPDNAQVKADSGAVKSAAVKLPASITKVAAMATLKDESLSRSVSQNSVSGAPSAKDNNELRPHRQTGNNAINTGNNRSQGQTGISRNTAGQNKGPIFNADHAIITTPQLLDDPKQIFDFNNTMISSFPLMSNTAPLLPPWALPASKNKGKSTAPKTNAPATSQLEWGLLLGVNAPGSFTPKSQNSNFYGGLLVDPFAGAYATYHINDKWGVGTQLRLLSPSILKGTYEKSTYTQRIDTINVLITHKTSDSRKLYSVQVPVYAVYQVNHVLSLKAGPVLSFPTKQFSIAKTDSASRQLLTASHYDQKFDAGLTGGVSFRYKRLSFDATYLRGLTTHTVSGDSLNYKVHNSQVQFTIGIQIGGKKR